MSQCNLVSVQALPRPLNRILTDSGSEDRPDCKQHPKGMYCAPKHYERCQVGAENRLELTENKRRVSRIVDGLVTALTKGISWLREKGWH